MSFEKNLDITNRLFLTLDAFLSSIKENQKKVFSQKETSKFRHLGDLKEPLILKKAIINVKNIIKLS